MGPERACGDGHAGAATVLGLEPGTEYEVRVDNLHAGSVRTLPVPPGRELYRFATVNDVHIGERAFGYRRTIREEEAITPYPLRCLRAALAEAVLWGAQRMVVKGDLTDRGRAKEFTLIADELARLDLPVDVVLGNHDVKKPATDGVPVLRSAGIHVVTETEAVDLPGLRLVIAPTARPVDGRGQVRESQRQAIVDLVAASPTPVAVAVHHHPQRWRLFTSWPPGIPGNEAQPLLDAIERANPDTIVVAGHSHRHRLHHHGALRIAEIGSTKDYPGAWAGYVVYEGGMRQVVRRIAEPSALAWTERTRRTLFGLWSLWSPGTLRGRCWVATWSG